jgi:hypothetical protein
VIVRTLADGEHVVVLLGWRGDVCDFGLGSGEQRRGSESARPHERSERGGGGTARELKVGDARRTCSTKSVSATAPARRADAMDSCAPSGTGGERDGDVSERGVGTSGRLESGREKAKGRAWSSSASP